jgi:hypothetical protein
VGSDYYEGSATPERHQLTASLPTRVGGVGRFPRSPLADRRGRCPAESRQPRHRYAAALPDGLLLGPVLRGRSRPPAPVGGRALQARPTSARFGAGRQLTGRQHWFLAYTCSSCLPDPGRLAVPTRPVVVGAAPTLPCASRVRLPPASPACCDKPAVESLHLHSVKRNLVAHVGSSRGAVPPLPAARFPGPHLRTRRARRHATGSPQAPAACATGADVCWIRSTRSPRRPGIHQEPPAVPATPRPARCLPSPCAHLSWARTTTKAPPRPNATS